MGFFFKDKITPPKVSGKPREIKQWRVAGVIYECRKNPSRKRLDVLKPMKPGSALVLEQFVYNGRPAYMVVDCKSGLDIGVLYENNAEFLSECFPRAKFIGKLVESNDHSALASFDIYGERMAYNHFSKAQAGVIYKAYKDNKINASKKLMSLIYDVAEREEQPKELVSVFGRVVEKIFEEDYGGANKILKDAFG